MPILSNKQVEELKGAINSANDNAEIRGNVKDFLRQFSFFEGKWAHFPNLGDTQEKMTTAFKEIGYEPVFKLDAPKKNQPKPEPYYSISLDGIGKAEKAKDTGRGRS